jgi:hypothetical protein
MEHFVQLEQPANIVLMVLVGGQERFLLPAAQNHAGARVPIALLELAATSAAVVPPGIFGKLVSTAIKSPNPSDEYMMGLKRDNEIESKASPARPCGVKQTSEKYS